MSALARGALFCHDPGVDQDLSQPPASPMRAPPYGQAGRRVAACAGAGTGSAFADSTYIQRQEFHLQPAPVWSWWIGFALAARRAVNDGLSPVCKAATRSSSTASAFSWTHSCWMLRKTPLRTAHGMGRFNCLALVVVIGDTLAPHAAKILADVAAQPIVARSPLIVSASPLRQGALLRVAGERVEELAGKFSELLALSPNYCTMTLVAKMVGSATKTKLKHASQSPRN